MKQGAKHAVKHAVKQVAMHAVKRLVLIRHAHRSTEDPAQDNGLSAKGLLQVDSLVEFAESRLENEAPFFFSSPKKRCQETLAPIAKRLKQRMEIDGRLSEHGPNEDPKLYLARIDEFLNFWKLECPEVTVICSHGDWIPLAIQRLTGAKVELKKAGWCEIELTGGEAQISWIVQRL